MSSFSETIEYNGIYFEVGGVMKRGSPRTQDYPGDHDDIEITSIKLGENEVMSDLPHDIIQGFKDDILEDLL